MRECGCGCGESLEGMRSTSLYKTDSCKAKAWRERHGVRIQAVKIKPPRRSPATPPRPRIDYLRAVEAIGADHAHLLAPLLTAKGRKALEHHRSSA